MRQELFQAFAAVCGEGTTHEEVQCALRRTWALPWDNGRKAVLWGLVYDAHPTAERYGYRAQPCACGVLGPGREHHFWGCTAAQAVVAEVARHLPTGAPPGKPHLWLGQPPAGVPADPWRVVALAALCAMDHARRKIIALQ
jgi:hypothetical protein